MNASHITHEIVHGKGEDMHLKAGKQDHSVPALTEEKPCHHVPEHPEYDCDSDEELHVPVEVHVRGEDGRVQMMVKTITFRHALDGLYQVGKVCPRCKKVRKLSKIANVIRLC